MKHLNDDEAQQQFVKVVAAILRRVLQVEMEPPSRSSRDHGPVKQ